MSTTHENKDDFGQLRHELKAPLTRIHLYAEGLLSGMAGKVSQEQREYLEEIHRSAKIMIDTINKELGGSTTQHN